MITCQDLANSLPRTNGKVSLKGLAAAAQVYRDAYGIPHVRATSEPDAFLPRGLSPPRTGCGRWSMTGAEAADAGPRSWVSRD